MLLMMLTDPVRRRIIQLKPEFPTHIILFLMLQTQGLISINSPTQQVEFILTRKKNCNTCVPLDLLIFNILHLSITCYIFHLGTRELFCFFLVKNRKCSVRDLCFQGKDSELFFTLVCLAFLFSFFQRQLFLDSGKLFLAFKKKMVWFLILILQQNLS